MKLVLFALAGLFYVTGVHAATSDMGTPITAVSPQVPEAVKTACSRLSNGAPLDALDVLDGRDLGLYEAVWHQGNKESIADVSATGELAAMSNELNLNDLPPNITQA